MIQFYKRETGRQVSLPSSISSVFEVVFQLLNPSAHRFHFGDVFLLAVLFNDAFAFVIELYRHLVRFRVVGRTTHFFRSQFITSLKNF